MHGPPLVGWLLVALAGATGLYCLARMRSECPEERSAAGGEALMGIGMAAMAVPSAASGPQPYGSAAFAAVFGLVAVRSVALACRTGHRGHHAHHAVASAAMVYMALAAPAGPVGAGGAAANGLHMVHRSSGVPALTGALLAYFALYALWAGTRLVPVAPRAASAVPAPAVPELAPACRVSMGIGMFAMLLAM